MNDVNFGLCSVWMSLALGAAGSFVACGGPTTPVSPLGGPSASAATTASGPTDLSEVRPPAGLVAEARFRDVASVLGTFKKWSKLPMPSSRHFTEAMTSERLGDLVDLAAPIDIAAASVAKDKPVLWVISAALTDVEAAKKEIVHDFKLVPMDNGVVKIDGIGRKQRGVPVGIVALVDRLFGTSEDSDDSEDGEKEESDDDSDTRSSARKPTVDAGKDAAPDEEQKKEKRACWIMPAPQGAASRLVCGGTSEALTALGPYITRTVPRRSNPDAALSFRVDTQSLIPRLAPIRYGLASYLAGELFPVTGYNRKLSQGTHEMAGSLVDVFADTSSVSFQGKVIEGGASPGLEGTFEVQLRQSSSGLTRLAAAGTSPRAAPKEFWALPADSTFAVFHEAYDKGELDRPAEGVARVLTAGLARVVGNAEALPVEKAVRDLLPRGRGVYASGVDAAKVARSTQGLDAPRYGYGYRGTSAVDDVDAKVRASGDIFGFRVWGTEEPIARFSAGLKDLTAAWSKPSLQKALRDHYKSSPLPTIRMGTLPRDMKFPAGSLHLEVTTYPVEAAPPVPSLPPKPPAAAKKPVPFTVHAFFVPGASHTWIAVAASEREAAQRALAALSGTGDTLERKEGLGSLRSATGTLGGFVSPADMFSLVHAGNVIATEHRSYRSPFRAVASHYDRYSKKKGATNPVAFVFAPTAGPGKGLVLRTRLSDAVVFDAIEFALQTF